MADYPATAVARIVLRSASSGRETPNRNTAGRTALSARTAARAVVTTDYTARATVLFGVRTRARRGPSAAETGIGVRYVLRDAMRMWGGCCDDGTVSDCVLEEATNCLNAAMQHIYARATIIPFISRRRQFYRCPAGAREVALPFDVQQVKGAGREYYVVEFYATTAEDQSAGTAVSPLVGGWDIYWNVANVGGGVFPYEKMGAAQSEGQSFSRWLNTTGAKHGVMTSVTPTAWRFTLFFEEIPTFPNGTPTGFAGRNGSTGGTGFEWLPIQGAMRWMAPVASEQQVADYASLYGADSRAYYVWGGDSNHQTGALGVTLDMTLPFQFPGAAHSDGNVTKVPMGGDGVFWSGKISSVDAAGGIVWLLRSVQDSGVWEVVQTLATGDDDTVEFAFTSTDGYCYGFEADASGAASLTASNSETIETLNADSVKAWVSFNKPADTTIGFSLDVQMEPARYSAADYSAATSRVVPFPNAYIESVLLPVARWYASNSTRFTAHDRAAAIGEQYEAAMNIIRGLDPAPVVVREGGEPDNPSKKA